MKQLVLRIVFGLLYVVVLLWCLYTGFISFATCLFILGGITLKEYTTLIKKNSILFLSIYSLLYGGFVYLYFYNIHSYYFPAVMTVLGFGTILHTLLGINVFRSKKSSITKFIEPLYIIIAVLCLFSVGCLPIRPMMYDYKVILAVFFLIWFNDSFAFLFGKMMGRHKLLPSVSPKKTIEGLFGGLVSCIMLSGFLAKYNMDYSLTFWVCLAVLVSLLGTLGDLVQSRFKRIAQVKDSGSILPGHGGMFDRLDSVLFVAPYILLILLIISYVS